MYSVCLVLLLPNVYVSIKNLHTAHHPELRIQAPGHQQQSGQIIVSPPNAQQYIVPQSFDYKA